MRETEESIRLKLDRIERIMKGNSLEICWK